MSSTMTHHRFRAARWCMAHGPWFTRSRTPQAPVGPGLLKHQRVDGFIAPDDHLPLRSVCTDLALARKGLWCEPSHSRDLHRPYLVGQGWAARVGVL
jgi:hypothetical protein